MTKQLEFTPAAGRFAPTALYDIGVALLTRESVWRGELLKRLSVAAGERIIDVGCGTGSLAIMLKQAHPDAQVTGLDPDPEALAIAQRKAETAGLKIDWRLGFASDAAKFGSFDKTVSSLVFHQVSTEGKRAGIAAMYAATKLGGEMFIADYAIQKSWHMRQLFRIIQMLDGRTNTQPNADGFIENEMSSIFGKSVVSVYTLDTPTGTISLFGEHKQQAVGSQGEMSL